MRTRAALLLLALVASSLATAYAQSCTDVAPTCANVGTSNCDSSAVGQKNAGGCSGGSTCTAINPTIQAGTTGCQCNCQPATCPIVYQCQRSTGG